MVGTDVVGMGSCVSQPADGSQVHLTASGANMSWGNDVKVSTKHAPTRPPQTATSPPSAKTSTATNNSNKEPRFHGKVQNHSPSATPFAPSPPLRPASAGGAQITLPDIITAPRQDPLDVLSQEQQQAASLDTATAAATKEKTGVEDGADGDGGGDGGCLKRKDSKNASMQTDTAAKSTKEGGSTKEKKKKSLIRKGKAL